MQKRVAAYQGGVIMKLVITMSRRYGTGSTEIAQELAKRLNIPVYNKDIIGQEANERTYESEAEDIRRLAESPCIILGRLACEVLKDRLNVLNIFVSAEKDFRIHRIMESNSLGYEDAKALVEKTDEARADYYNKCTGRAWGDIADYHMILDTAELGVDNCPDIIMQYLKLTEFI